MKQLVPAVGARIDKANVEPAEPNEIRTRFEEEGLSPHDWGNVPNDRYDWHAHAYQKVLYCVSGSVVFHTREGDLALEPGDRMELDPGTDHAATVGPHGVRCMEAARRP